MTDLCLRELSAEARLDIVYRWSIRERIQKLTRCALVARLLNYRRHAGAR